jgi:cell division protein FtsB
MRLSKTIWIVLGVAVFIIGFVVLYMMYSRQGGEQDQLKSQIASNQATLLKLITEKGSWQSQLAQLQDELAERQSALAEAKLALSQAGTGWPESAESIEYDEKLFEIADAWNLDIIVAKAAEPGEETLEGVTFTTSSFNVQVKGKPREADELSTTDVEYREYLYKTVSDILAFLHTIVMDKDFASAGIELVDMQVPEPLTQEDIDSDTEQESPTAQITLTIYTYKGR